MSVTTKHTEFVKHLLEHYNSSSYHASSPFSTLFTAFTTPPLPNHVPHSSTHAAVFFLTLLGILFLILFISVCTTQQEEDQNAADASETTTTSCCTTNRRVALMVVILAIAIPLTSYTANLLTSESPLAILNVPLTASLTDVRHAWRRLAADLHPDRGGPHSPAEQTVRAAALDKVRAAYETVMAAGSVEAAAAAHQGPPLTMGLPEFLAEPSLELYVLGGFLALLLSVVLAIYLVVRHYRPEALSIGFEKKERRHRHRQDSGLDHVNEDHDPFSGAGVGVRLGGGGGDAQPSHDYDYDNDDDDDQHAVEPCPLCGEGVPAYRLEAHVNRCLDAVEDVAAAAAEADRRCDDCTVALASHECPECGLWYCLECGSRLHRRGTFVSHAWVSLVSPDVETLMAE